MPKRKQTPGTAERDRKMKAKSKAEKMLKVALIGCTLKQLELAWKATDTPGIATLEDAILRGAIMDELETRYPEKFEEWLDNENFAIFA